MTVSPALRFTYDDYLLLPEDRRYEIIDGDLFMTQDLKKKLCTRFGVREFWIADPEGKTVEILVNTTEGFRRESLFGAAEALRSPFSRA